MDKKALEALRGQNQVLHRAAIFDVVPEDLEDIEVLRLVRKLAKSNVAIIHRNAVRLIKAWHGFPYYVTIEHQGVRGILLNSKSCVYKQAVAFPRPHLWRMLGISALKPALVKFSPQQADTHCYHIKLEEPAGHYLALDKEGMGKLFGLPRNWPILAIPVQHDPDGEREFVANRQRLEDIAT